jgi:hypothetical protein
MLMRGLHIQGNYSRPLVILAALSGIAFLAYKCLSVKTTSENSSTVYGLLLNSGLNETLSKYATAQAAHETNGFTSNVFQTNNNLFGMKYAGQYNAAGEKNGYANYKTIGNSVADFVAWYSTHRSSLLSLPLYISSITSYVRFLKNNNYFEADETAYLNGCKYWLNLIFNEQS